MTAEVIDVVRLDGTEEELVEPAWALLDLVVRLAFAMRLVQFLTLLNELLWLAAVVLRFR